MLEKLIQMFFVLNALLLGSTSFWRNKSRGLAEWLKQEEHLPSNCKALSSKPTATKSAADSYF
jgi:hypothetical protein